MKNYLNSAKLSFLQSVITGFGSDELEYIELTTLVFWTALVGSPKRLTSRAILATGYGASKSWWAADAVFTR